MKILFESKEFTSEVYLIRDHEGDIVKICNDLDCANELVNSSQTIESITLNDDMIDFLDRKGILEYV